MNENIIKKTHTGRLALERKTTKKEKKNNL